MDSYPQLLDRLLERGVQLSESPTRAGRPIRLERTSDNRDKHSAWLAFECNSMGGEILVWDSGELEFVFGRSGGPVPEVMEHHDISTVPELDALIDRLIGLFDESSGSIGEGWLDEPLS